MEALLVKGTHPVMEKILNISERVAVTDSTVMISGESGTGKELIARFIHNSSKRASNRDLAVEVEKGRFREDLFYRLQVIPILVPPLRERRSDIPTLVTHFLQKHNQQRGSQPCQILADAMVHLWEYDWPGNVRELE